MGENLNQSPIRALSAAAQLFDLETDDEWREAYPVLADLKPEFTLDDCLAERENWLAVGGKLLAVRHEQVIVAVGALLITKNLFRGTEMLINAMDTLPEFRSYGYGFAIMQYAEELGRFHGCDRLILHSRSERERAHAFYENKCGMERRGYVFTKDLRESDNNLGE